MACPARHKPHSNARARRVVISTAMKTKHIHCSGSDTCEEVFESDRSMERHVLLRHTKLPCDLCKEKFYANEMIGHQKHECLMRSVPCKW